MNRNLSAVGLVVMAALALAVNLRWRTSRDAKGRAARAAAILRVVDTTSEGGWVETFTTPQSQPLAGYDPRWRPIFGRIIVDKRLGAAIGDPEGGWQRDGGDDYAFRATDAPTGSVQIVMDGWWDGVGSIGTQGAVQADPPHRLYEATLWRGKLTLVYFVGPRPDQFEILTESPPLPVKKGFYRLVLCMDRSAEGWKLSASLRDPARDYTVVGHVSATDSRLGLGGQGIGILGGGGTRSSYITGIAVRGTTKVPGAPQPEPSRAPLCDPS